MRRRDLVVLLGGATIAWPAGARAQQLMPVIGYLSQASAQSDNIPPRLPAFRKGLNEMGFVEGENVTIEYRWVETKYDRLPALVADLVRRQVSVIVTRGAPPTFAAKAATSTIPIVFAHGLDPVQSGLVASLNRPGGNVTGVTISAVELMGKRLGLLHELVPTAADVAVLANPTSRTVTESETSNLQDAARSLGLRLHTVRASTPDEIDAAFGTLVELRAGGLVVSADELFTSQRTRIIALASHHALPAIYVYRLFPDDGGLISYGADLADAYRVMGIYTGKILKGANPANLPVQQPVKIELVINLNTAKVLGLTIPPSILARADEVIE
jgi:putative tryptophan/tyrosine transport system substrate-binding protein